MFNGLFDGFTFLVIIEAFSKSLEIFLIKCTISERTFKVLYNIFATFGFPQYIVSHSRSQFTSKQLQRFIKSNGIKHTLNHMSMDGDSERFVQRLKRTLKYCRRE